MKHVKLLKIETRSSIRLITITSWKTILFKPNLHLTLIFI